MDQLLALAVAVPLLVAATVTACGPLLRSRRRILDLVAILAAACVAVMLGVIMIRTAGGDQVYWFAGFRPAHGVSIGIDFEVQPLSAGLACLAAVLVTAAMTFSWRYFEGVATYYHGLMLTFLAGITGFCLTGDLFDLFVWFELMGVSAYALTAYRPEERGPIQGALNFAITNSVGAYLSLSGIGLIYGRTGALNMAQIGVSIAKHPADRLVVVAFLLVISGLLIKSAIVPFHFWLADAHAVAPTPVCVLFSGVMVELGLYGIARVYWSVFGQALGHRAAISHVFLALGLLTAVAGALFCIRERHIKRLLAFSTISHAGMFLIGIGLLTPLGLAGAAVYVIGHGLVKGALFLCTGIVLHRLGSVNEPWLHGRGRKLRVTGVVFTLAGLGLADLPPFATFLGKGWIEASAAAWFIPVLVVCSSLVGGAVLRVAGGVFYGLGDPPAEDPQMAKAAAEETSETTGGKNRTPLTMIVPPALLVVAAIGVGLIGRLGPVVQTAAVRFEDQAGYNATVLFGAHVTHPVALSAPGPADVTAASVLTGLGSVAGALIVAGLALYWRRLPLLRAYRPNAAIAVAARRFQSGVVNDYVTWIVVGLACLGGIVAAVTRLRPGRLIPVPWLSGRMPNGSPEPANPVTLEPHQCRQMAESFGVDPERYDRTRPRYPDALVERIVAASPGPEFLDVGCGTGIAARQFRAAGRRVLGVEPDARMADFARRTGIEVETATFEAWDNAGRTFDAVVAGQAWHWVDPVAGAAKAAQVLRPDGRLAAFWHVFEPPQDVAEACGAVFNRLVPDSPLSSQTRPPDRDRIAAGFTARAADGIRAAGGFGDAESWRYDWERSYSRDEWLDQLATSGALTPLPPDRLAEVLAALGAALDGLAVSITVRLTTVAIMAARCGPP